MQEGSSRELEQDEIKRLLQGGRKSKGSTTEPRDVANWYRQNHILNIKGCENPNCKDPRPHTDVGTQIVVLVDEKRVCRFCFLDGWLSRTV